MPTYNRKYYLIREIKKAGFGLVKSENERTILVPSDLVVEASVNRHVQDLMHTYNYGVQLVTSPDQPETKPTTSELISVVNRDFPHKAVNFFTYVKSILRIGRLTKHV